MAGVLWTLTKSRSLKHKKERGQYAAIVTKQAGSMKDSLNGPKEDFSTLDQRGRCRAGNMGPAKINPIVLRKH